MTAALPTGWRGRLLALALLSVALAAAYVVVAAPVLDLYAGRAAFAQDQRALLSRLNAVAGELPALRAHVAEWRAAAADNKLILDGASDAIASAALEGHIEEFAAAAGVKIGSTESLPTETQGPYRRLGLRLVITSSYEGLVNLLAKLETATPPLIVDNLQIHSFEIQPGVVNPAPLNANLEVYGFRAGGNSSGAAKQ